MIDTLNDLGKPDTPEFCFDNETKVFREIIVDFLFRIKDKLPLSDRVERNIADVLKTIMEFLFGCSFEPSSALFKEYSESKLTKELNTLPPLEYINSNVLGNYQMSEGVYELLRKKFESRPLFVFYFNPNIQMQEIVADNFLLMKGFFDADDVSANK